VVVVSGPVASGKTTLLHAFAQRASGTDVGVLTVSASRAECGLPLGVVSGLFRSADLEPESGERVSRLLRDGTLTATLQEGESDPAALARLTAPILDGLRTELLHLAERRPLLIGIDDAHYADDASLHFLLYLARRLDTERILLLLGKSPQLHSAHAAFYADLDRLPHYRAISTGPLSRAGVAGVLAEQLGEQTAQHLAPACHKVTGGNPLLVQALCEDSRTLTHETPAGLVVGSAFEQGVLTCLCRCEPTLLSLAGAVAVLDDAVSERILGKLIGVDPATVAKALARLNEIGILNFLHFRHPRARAAVLGHLTQDDRQALNVRAARSLHEEGAAATVVARHLISAGRLDEPWVVAVLREAADSALHDNDLNLAISALRLAHRLSADDRERAAITAALARTEWQYDPAMAGRRLPELLKAAHSGKLTGADAVMTIGHLVWKGDPAQAMTTLARLDGAPADLGTGTDLTTARIWLSLAYPDLRDDDPPPAEPATTGPEDANSDIQLAAAYRLAVLLTGATKEADDSDAEHILERSRLGRPPLVPIITALTTLVCTGNLRRAAYWSDLLREKAAAEGRAPMWHAVVTAAHATIRLLRGDLAKAEHGARVALGLIPPKSWGVAVGGPLGALVLAATRQGRQDVAATYLEFPVPDAMFQTAFALPYLRSRGWYYLMTGRPGAALADFRACGDTMTRWGVDLPALVPWRTDAAQAYLELGDIGQAALLADEQLAIARPRTTVHGISLRVKAMAGDSGERLPLLESAAKDLQACGDVYELALALAELSRAWRSVGEHDRSNTLARRSHQLAGACAAAPLRDRLAPESRLEHECWSDDGKLGTFDELSDAERKVAVLAAQGYLNREIAGRLYITVSTVEQHLTRVYRKLKVKRRSELPGDLRHAALD